MTVSAGPVDLQAPLQRDPRFKSRLQQRMAGHLGAFVEDLRRCVRACAAAVKTQLDPTAEVVLILDSIVRLRGTPANAGQIHASPELLFAAHADMLRLLGEVVRRAETVPVDDRTVGDAISAIRSDVLPIKDQDRERLARVPATHAAALPDGARLADFARFLDTPPVLCFRNGHEWHDVHPRIRELVADAPPAGRGKARRPPRKGTRA